MDKSVQSVDKSDQLDHNLVGGGENNEVDGNDAIFEGKVLNVDNEDAEHVVMNSDDEVGQHSDYDDEF